MDAYAHLEAYYNRYDEEGRLASRAGQVEFLTTMRYVERYLKPGAHILEIGAGTGRYSHDLAGKGYPVDAIDLIPHQIDIFRALTQPGEQVTIRQGNATDLGGMEDGAYDVTLLLGPMYHLFEQEEQKKALSEAVRVTRPGGMLFVAYCMNDPTVIDYCFVKGNMAQILKKDLLDTDTFQTRSTPEEFFVLYRRETIDRLIAPLPVERLHFVGTDLITSFFYSENAFATASTVLGTLIGFVTGIYLPIGMLPEAVQWVVKLFPPSHAALLLRRVMMGDLLSQTFAGAPASAAEEFASMMGLRFTFGSVTLPVWASIFILIGTGIAFFGLAVLRISQKRK